MEPHELLRIRPDADKATARRAWIVLSRENHPDNHGENYTARQARLNDAYAQFTGKQAAPRPVAQQAPVDDVDLDLLFTTPDPAPASTQRPQAPVEHEPVPDADDLLDALFDTPTEPVVDEPPVNPVDDEPPVNPVDDVAPADEAIDPLEAVLAADVRGGKRLPRERRRNTSATAPDELRRTERLPKDHSQLTPASFSMPEVNQDTLAVIGAGAAALVARAVVTRGEAPAPLLAPFLVIVGVVIVGVIALLRFAHRRHTGIAVVSVIALGFVEATVFLLAAAAVIAPVAAWRADHRTGGEPS